MIGDRLTALRKASGRSQEEMAKELGVSRSGYQYYERNERDLPSALLLKICQIFNDDPSRLLTGQPPDIMLKKIEEISEIIDERLEDMDIHLSHKRKWRVISRVLMNLYRMPDGIKSAKIDIDEIDGLLEMVA